MHTVCREIVILPLFVRYDRRARGFKPLNGLSNRILIERSEVRRSSLSPFASRLMRSRGLGILPVGSVGMVVDVGVAILTTFLR